jgi:FtsP/CotA-like multicopper oxidase with cupredoxin domain
MDMKRRDFLKLSAAGVATIVLSTKIPGIGLLDAYAADQSLEIHITDALKEMVTHNEINTAQCYFWIYRMKANGVDVPPDCPGPTIVALKGDTIALKITNELDEPHSFVIPGIFDSGPIAPGATFNGILTASVTGAHLYHDNLNAPVNRVMGLHGALVVRPTAPAPGIGNKLTPYDNPSPHVQNLYNEFGSSCWPGLAWDEAGPGTPPALDENPFITGNAYAPPCRSYVWLTHQASPKLFAEVGDYTPGLDYPAGQFTDKFLRSPFSPTRGTYNPEYFTINGQSGFFSHFSPQITPMGRVGEPVVVHIMNAGLWTHSMHLHANHFFVTSINGVPNPNPIWLDVYGVLPMDRIDYTIPFMRPPSVPSVTFDGMQSTPLTTLNGHPCYPPAEEFEVYMPPKGTTAFAQDGITPVELGQRMAPLCYPMHDHSEPSQTAQGGNYNCGLISGIYILGDRNLPGSMNFPMDEDFLMMYRNIRGITGATGGRATYPAPGPRP